MAEPGRGSTIASRIAQFRAGGARQQGREPGSQPETQHKSPNRHDQFWWQTGTQGQLPAAPSPQKPVPTKPHVGADVASSDQGTPVSHNPDNTARPGSNASVEDLAQQLATSNPELYSVLAQLERDPSGKLSASTLARINEVMAGTQKKHASASQALPAAMEQEDSADSLQAALNRYRKTPTAVAGTSQRMAAAPAAASISSQCAMPGHTTSRITPHGSSQEPTHSAAQSTNTMPPAHAVSAVPQGIAERKGRAQVTTTKGGQEFSFPASMTTAAPSTTTAAAVPSVVKVAASADNHSAAHMPLPKAAAAVPAKSQPSNTAASVPGTEALVAEASFSLPPASSSAAKPAAVAAPVVAASDPPALLQSLAAAGGQPGHQNNTQKLCTAQPALPLSKDSTVTGVSQPVCSPAESMQLPQAAQQSQCGPMDPAKQVSTAQSLQAAPAVQQEPTGDKSRGVQQTTSVVPPQSQTTGTSPAGTAASQGHKMDSILQQDSGIPVNIGVQSSPAASTIQPAVALAPCTAGAGDPLSTTSSCRSLPARPVPVAAPALQSQQVVAPHANNAAAPSAAQAAAPALAVSNSQQLNPAAAASSSPAAAAAAAAAAAGGPSSTKDTQANQPPSAAGLIQPAVQGVPAATHTVLSIAGSATPATTSSAADAPMAPNPAAVPAAAAPIALDPVAVLTAGAAVAGAPTAVPTPAGSQAAKGMATAGAQATNTLSSFGAATTTTGPASTVWMQQPMPSPAPTQLVTSAPTPLPTSLPPASPTASASPTDPAAAASTGNSISPTPGKPAAPPVATMPAAWSPNQPHGMPIILPGIAGVRPPMIFVPAASPSHANSPTTQSRSPSPEHLSPTHMFVPSAPGSPPRLMSVPGYPSYPAPASKPNRPTQDCLAERAAVLPDKPSGGPVTGPLTGPPNQSRGSPDNRPSQTASSGMPAAAAAPTQLTSAAAGKDVPEITFQVNPAPKVSPPASPSTSQATEPASPAQVASPAATMTAHSTGPRVAGCTDMQLPGSRSTSPPALAAMQTAPAVLPVQPSSQSAISQPTPIADPTATAAPGAAAAPAVMCANTGSPAAAGRPDRAEVSVSEASRRARDLVELEAHSPPRTRITRLVEEVEAQRRRTREEIIRREERSKLQGMKWEELETYLGQKAAAVQDVRRMKWETISLKKDMGSVPPKKLAQQFLEKAEALRGAAIQSAVQQAVQDSSRQHEQADRDAGILHQSLDAQHAMALTEHRHTLDSAQLLGQAAAAALSATSRPQMLTDMFWSRSAGSSPHRLRPGPTSLPHGPGSLADPHWATALMSTGTDGSTWSRPVVRRPASPPQAGAGAARAARRAITSSSDDSSSDSSGSDDAGVGAMQQPTAQQQAAALAGSSNGHNDSKQHSKQKLGKRTKGLASPSHAASSHHAGSPSKHASVDQITTAARQVSLQVDSAVSEFLRRTCGQPATGIDRPTSPTPSQPPAMQAAMNYLSSSTVHFDTNPVLGAAPVIRSMSPGRPSVSIAGPLHHTVASIWPMGTTSVPSVPEMPGSSIGEAAGTDVMSHSLFVAQQQAIAAQQAAIALQHQLLQQHAIQEQQREAAAAAHAVSVASSTQNMATSAVAAGAQQQQAALASQEWPVADTTKASQTDVGSSPIRLATRSVAACEVPAAQADSVTASQQAQLVTPPTAAEHRTAPVTHSSVSEHVAAKPLAGEPAAQQQQPQVAPSDRGHQVASASPKHVQQGTYAPEPAAVVMQQGLQGSYAAEPMQHQQPVQPAVACSSVTAEPQQQQQFVTDQLSPAQLQQQQQSLTDQLPPAQLQQQQVMQGMQAGQAWPVQPQQQFVVPMQATGSYPTLSAASMQPAAAGAMPAPGYASLMRAHNGYIPAPALGVGLAPVGDTASGFAQPVPWVMTDSGSPGGSAYMLLAQSEQQPQTTAMLPPRYAFWPGLGMLPGQDLPAMMLPMTQPMLPGNPMHAGHAVSHAPSAQAVLSATAEPMAAGQVSNSAHTIPSTMQAGPMGTAPAMQMHHPSNTRTAGYEQSAGMTAGSRPGTPLTPHLGMDMQGASSTQQPAGRETHIDMLTLSSRDGSEEVAPEQDNPAQTYYVPNSTAGIERGGTTQTRPRHHLRPASMPVHLPFTTLMLAAGTAQTLPLQQQAVEVLQSHTAASRPAQQQMYAAELAIPLTSSTTDVQRLTGGMHHPAQLSAVSAASSVPPQMSVRRQQPQQGTLAAAPVAPAAAAYMVSNTQPATLYFQNQSHVMANPASGALNPQQLYSTALPGSPVMQQRGHELYHHPRMTASVPSSPWRHQSQAAVPVAHAPQSRELYAALAAAGGSYDSITRQQLLQVFGPAALQGHHQP